jgi:DNA-binding MarR family transcriptional regulator
MASTDYALLADVRHSLRALNGVIEAGAKAAGLTVQQQGFLLSLAARGGTHVPLADLRADLGMDQATTSELLGRLGRRGLVTRGTRIDRRAVDVALTQSGRSALTRSVRAIGREMKLARTRGDLDALQRNLRAYVAFHTESQRVAHGARPGSSRRALPSR